MVAVGITFVYALFAVFEIVSLKRSKQKKELIVFCTIFLISYVISMLIAFGVKIPSFDRMLGDLIIPLVGDSQ